MLLLRILVTLKRQKPGGKNKAHRRGCTNDPQWWGTAAGKKRKELLMIVVWTRNLIIKFKKIWRYLLDRLPVAEFDRLPVPDVSLKKFAKLPASVIFFAKWPVSRFNNLTVPKKLQKNDKLHATPS